MLPTRESGRTPPPKNGKGERGNGSGQRGKMGISGLLAPEESGGRTSADSDMVKALDRKGM